MSEQATWIDSLVAMKNRENPWAATLEQDQTSLCTKCNKRKPRNQFNAVQIRWNRCDSLCKTCRNAQTRKRYTKNPERKLSNNVSARMRKSLRSNKRGVHWELLVSFTLAELRAHLESLFEDKMTWENYGSAWEIDHIKPVIKFSFEDYKDTGFCECWALSNLMPRWATTAIAREHGSNQIGNRNKDTNARRP